MFKLLWRSVENRFRYILILILTLGSYFSIVFYKIISLRPEGIYAGHVNVWSDWSLHIAIANIFAFKDFIPNLVAGIYIHQKKLFLVGDTINIKDIEGKILKTDLTETVVITKDKDTIFIPNSIIIKYKLIKKGKNQKI